MKSILTISSACILACASGAFAQNTPAPIPAAPLIPASKACEVSKESLEVETQILAYTKEFSDLCSTVKDKASADAIAGKMAKLMEKQAALASKAMSQQPSKISDANQEALMTAGMKAAGEGMRLKQANYYGSQTLKDAMEKMPEGAPATTPAPAAK